MSLLRRRMGPVAGHRIAGHRLGGFATLRREVSCDIRRCRTLPSQRTIIARPKDTVPESRLLSGWKEIAAYFGRDVRTVQRWEAKEGLPVHRHQHDKLSTVHAKSDELDAWLRSRASQASADGDSAIESPQPAVRPWLWTVRAVTLLLIVVGLVLVRGALGADPAILDSSADSDIRVAEGYYKAARYEEASAILERTVVSSPDDGRAWAMLAKSYSRPAARAQLPENASRALAAAQRAAQLAPGAPGSHVALALAHRARQDKPLLRAAALRATELEPNNAEAWSLLGDSYSLRLGDGCADDRNGELAAEYYARAARVDPTNTSWSNLLVNLRYLGRLDECVTKASEALRILPAHPLIRVARGRCLIMQRRLDLAEAEIRDAVQDHRGPDLAGAAAPAPSGSLDLDLAWIDLLRGRVENGSTSVEEVVAAVPTVGNHLVAALVYLDAGLQEPGRRHLDAAVEKDAACRDFISSAPPFRPYLAPEQRRR